MLHHEESPEKPQYNMATPPFLDKPPTPHHPTPLFYQKFSDPPRPQFLLDKMVSATKFDLLKKFNIFAAALELKICV